MEFLLIVLYDCLKSFSQILAFNYDSFINLLEHKIARWKHIHRKNPYHSHLCYRKCLYFNCFKDNLYLIYSILSIHITTNNHLNIIKIDCWNTIMTKSIIKRIHANPCISKLYFMSHVHIKYITCFNTLLLTNGNWCISLDNFILISIAMFSTNFRHNCPNKIKL